MIEPDDPGDGSDSTAGGEQTSPLSQQPDVEKIGSWPEFESGDQLAGRYRIERFIAKGGMGEIYRADDLTLGVTVALKVVRKAIASHSDALRRFRHEVLLARSVTHPGVCRIYDLGCHRARGRESWFFTMELLAGETLAARIEARGRLTRRESLPLVRQMAEALDAAHRAGVVHRDFKSQNIMLVPTGSGDRVVITDFGLAISADRTARRDPSTRAARSPDTDTDTIDSDVGIAGTPAYMAPEQVRGEPVGPAADLYALGVVLFEMATGSLPFRGNSPHETAQARLYQDPPIPSSLADVDPDWEAAVLRLLSRDPADRFSSARDVVAALERTGPPASGHPHSLPAESDLFLGRRREMDAIATAFQADARMLTLLGMAGMGKTRLARHYGRRALEQWPGGVWFVDLSEVRDLAGIVSAVAAGLRVRLGRGDPVVELGHALASRGRCLVILDNFEQVAEHAAATLGRWLGQSNAARFLITSRQRLQLPEESVLVLEALDVETEGVPMFDARARTQRPDLGVSSGTRETITEIVRILDGHPLAIELAASRLRMLSLEQLRGRLSDRFRLLADPQRGRHGTLRAALDWSWDLLRPWEQAAVAQASVFDAGFTLEAAEEILDLSLWPEAPPILDIVQALTDRSWLRIRVEEEVPRFAMYTSVQEYAREMYEHGDIAEAERRHERFYARYGNDTMLEALSRSEGLATRKLMRAELGNLRSACRRATRRGDAATAVDLLAAVWTVIRDVGPFDEAVELAGPVISLAGIAPDLKARALESLGSALRATGRSDDSTVALEQALAIWRSIGDRRMVGRTLSALGLVLRLRGQMEEASRALNEARVIHREVSDLTYEPVTLNNLATLLKDLDRKAEARQLLEQAHDANLRTGSLAGAGDVLGNLGNLYMEEGRMDEARRCQEAAIAINRELGNRRNEGTGLGNVANILFMQEHYEEALHIYERALAIHVEIADIRGQALVLSNIGSLRHSQERLLDAQSLYRRALNLYRRIGDPRGESRLLLSLGILHRDLGQLEEALRCFEPALALNRITGNRAAEGMTLMHRAMALQKQGRVEEAEAENAQALALAREVGDRQLEASTLESLAQLLAQGGRFEEARGLLDRAIAIARDIGEAAGLGRLLGTRADCERSSGAIETAASFLADAESLADRIGASIDGELRRHLARVRESLEGKGRGS